MTIQRMFALLQSPWNTFTEASTSTPRFGTSQSLWIPVLSCIIVDISITIDSCSFSLACFGTVAKR